MLCIRLCHNRVYHLPSPQSWSLKHFPLMLENTPIVGGSQYSLGLIITLSRGVQSVRTGSILTHRYIPCPHWLIRNLLQVQINEDFEIPNINVCSSHRFWEMVEKLGTFCLERAISQGLYTLHFQIQWGHLIVFRTTVWSYPFQYLPHIYQFAALLLSLC